MSREAKIVATFGVVLALFFAVNSCQKEYRRIQSRVETTQVKVDALADELRETAATIHAAIRSITERFLAIEASAQNHGDIGQQLGQMEEVQVVPSVVEPTIMMHSGYSCGSCNSWIANCMPRWIKAGWRVEVVKEIESQRSWPWYEITDRDGSKFEVIGPLTNDRFKQSKPLK